MLYDKKISDCIRATAKRAKKSDGSAPFDCTGLSCDKCPFDSNCSESSWSYTTQKWIEVLQEKGVTIDPALVAEYCNTDTPTVLTDTIKYLEKQYKYIEETIEDEILRDNPIKYLNKASVAIDNALKHLYAADLMLRKQRGDQL